MSFPTLSQLRALLDSKQASAVELAQEALKKAQAHSDLNAFLDINESSTLAQAKEADALLAKGEHHYLTGIPLAHKDLFVTQGWHTTAASKMLKGYRSPFDATVVHDLRQVGMVNIGKLNCDEFAMGSGNQNSAYGPCLNPWDKKAVPGGSSGGSAAAVAAGIVPVATGTDTGGSVRQPAALCGLSGMKPTYGAISRFGMIAYASSLDRAGMFAHNAQDLVETLDVLCHFDPKDSTSLQMCGRDHNQVGRVKTDFEQHRDHYASQGATPLKGLRIGIPNEYRGQGVASEVGLAIETALKTFEQLGATLVDISLPRTKLCIPAYYVIAPAEASSNLSRYDAVRYGHRAAQYEGLAQMQGLSRSQGFGPEVQRRIMVGTYVLSQGYYDAYYVQAQRIRRLIAQDYMAAFATQCDVIMGPVTPTVAKDIGSTKDITEDWLSDIFTLSLNLAGLPGLSIPCGLGGSQGNRPIGLQIIGNYFTEGQLLAVADCFQQHSDWHLRTPEL